MTTHSIVSAALMKRNQIAVGGGGEDETAASTYCLFEKYVRKCKVKIEWWLMGHFQLLKLLSTPCPSIDSNLFVHLATVSLPQNTLTVIKFLSYYHLDHAIM